MGCLVYLVGYSHFFYLILSQIKPHPKVDLNLFLVNGTTGEGLSLTVDERKTIAEAWMNNRQHLDHIMLHIGAANLRDTQKLVRTRHLFTLKEMS